MIELGSSSWVLLVLLVNLSSDAGDSTCISFSDGGTGHSRRMLRQSFCDVKHDRNVVHAIVDLQGIRNPCHPSGVVGIDGF
jgi:hypothetical protein